MFPKNTQIQKRLRSPAKKTHTVRGAYGNVIELTLNRGKAIKVHCTECMGFESSPVDCESKLCALWPFRGKSMAAYKKDRSTNK